MADAQSINDLTARAVNALSDEALTAVVVDAYLRGQELCEVKLSNFMLANSLATGHGETFDDLLRELEWQVKELRG